jgi:hypothetical protein
MRERTLRQFPEGPAYFMGGHTGSENKVKKKDESCKVTVISWSSLQVLNLVSTGWMLGVKTK